MADLFLRGDFRLHSGEASGFMINCKALTDHDLETLAWLIVGRVPPFGSVEGIPEGGLRLAAELERYARRGPLLIVDDVFTTGTSMEKHRSSRDAIGAVIFARRPCPDWVVPLFTLTPAGQ